MKWMLKMDQLLERPTEPLSLISWEEKEEIEVKLIRKTNAINFRETLRLWETRIRNTWKISLYMRLKSLSQSNHLWDDYNELSLTVSANPWIKSVTSLESNSI